MQSTQTQSGFEPGRPNESRPPETIAGLPRRKPSTKITIREFERLHEGVAYANTLGMVMNAELTIKFSVQEDEAGEDFNAFLKRFRSWCASRRSPCVYCYAWEHPPHTALHVHLQLHIRPDLLEVAKRWAAASLSGPHISSHFFKRRKNPTHISQWAWFRYITKGLDQTTGLTGEDGIVVKVAYLWGIRDRYQGEISLKRTGRSKVISANQVLRAVHRGELKSVFRGDSSLGFEQIWSSCWIDQFKAGPQYQNAISRLF